jgi:hypothetical protein
VEVHEVCNIFPLMTEEEYAELKKDIANHGMREAIRIYQGKVIDGRNRLRACEELGITPKTKEWDGQGSLVDYVVSLNLNRRHLSASQKATCALAAEAKLAEEGKKRMSEGGKFSRQGHPSDQGKEKIPDLNVTNVQGPQARDQAAALFGVNPRYVSDAKRVKEKDPELFEQVKAGKINLHTASGKVRKPKEDEDKSPFQKKQEAGAKAAKTRKLNEQKAVIEELKRTGQPLSVLNNGSRTKTSKIELSDALLEVASALIHRYTEDELNLIIDILVDHTGYHPE